MRKLTTWNVARFRTAYQRRGWTLQQVAVHSEIPYSAVRSYSAGGSTPTAGRLVKLARVLDVPTTELAPLTAAPTLHELRWHTGLTVVELAEAVGYSVSHTSNVLAGVVPITDPPRWTKALAVSAKRVAAAWEAARAEQVRE